MEKCNGWSNYPTWRVNLEIFDGSDMSEMFSDLFECGDRSALAAALREYADEIIERTSEPGLARDYAFAFMQNVNWHEIASHMLGEYAEEGA